MASFSTANLSMVVTMLLLGLLLVSLGKGAQSIGVCYGMLGNNLPDRQEVVNLYKSNNINRMRLYYPDDKAFSALKGSNIDVILDVRREELQAFASDKSAAAQWVEINIRRHWPDVKFRYITVGNEVIPTPSGDYSLAQYVHPAMENIHEAISSAGLQDSIKVSTAVQMGILNVNSYPPSEGSFTNEANNYMRPIVEFLVRTGAPLLANVYPYFAYVGDSNINLEFALFKSAPASQSQYQNLFDSMVDALYSALEKAGGPNVKIVVSESGWPSLGGKGASKENAQTYNSNLIKHVPQGTPKRPGEIETYIFAMFNENNKDGGETERNFGLFYPSKEPVYQINFS
ncbi:hypothetical protein AAC387_Pa03g1302 [Persea americana]